jgi:hypothetical protein
MQSCGKSKSNPLGLSDLRITDTLVCGGRSTTYVQQQRQSFNAFNTNGGKVMHPETNNPPILTLRYTDEDYALVCNVWRRELGLEPIV